MPITPDTKDWTWVLERPCPECGFDTRSFEPATTGAAIRAQVATWARILAGPEVDVRASDSVWSPLEYACHVRDVFRICDGRLRVMLESDDPVFSNWDQDATAIDDAYNGQDPAHVIAALRDAADTIATRFDTVTGSMWTRGGTRSDGARFTVDSFARYVIHDPIHHVWDVERLARPRSA